MPGKFPLFEGVISENVLFFLLVNSAALNGKILILLKEKNSLSVQNTFD